MTTAIVQEAYNVATATTLTVNATSLNPWVAPVVGNYIIGALSAAASPGTPGITGFTTFDAVRSNAAANIRAMIAGKVATAADTAIAMTSTASDNLVGHAIEVSGLGTNPVLHAIAASVEQPSGTTLAFGDITITDPEAILVAIVGFVGGQPGAARPTFDNSFSSTGAINRFGAAAYRRPGVTGTYTVTATWTTTITAFGFLAAIAPAPAAGGGGTGLYAGGGKL